MDYTANHFPGKNALDCRIFRIQSQTFSGGDTSGLPLPPQLRARRPHTPTPAWLKVVRGGSALVLGPRHQFPLGSPAFPLFVFHETTGSRSFNHTLAVAQSLATLLLLSVCMRCINRLTVQ